MNTINLDQQPTSIKIIEQGDDLTLVLTWFSRRIVLVSIMIAIIILVVWLAPATTAPFAVLLILRLLSLGLLYWMVAMMINRTEFQTNREILTVRHTPLPWPGNRQVVLSEVDQLFVTRSIRRRRASRTIYSYGVNAYLKNGERQSLVTDLIDPAAAAYVEQKLEHFLGSPIRR